MNIFSKPLGDFLHIRAFRPGISNYKTTLNPEKSTVKE
jgi:hypothetical protein